MARSRSIGGGNVGEFLELTVIPDATFASEITALIAAGTDVVGKFVSFVTSGNYTVTSPAAAAIPDGQIIAYEKDATSTYILTCRFWHYTDYEGTDHYHPVVLHLPYSSAPSLGEEVKINGDTYMNVEGVTTGGMGKVIGVDIQASGYCDVLV